MRSFPGYLNLTHCYICTCMNIKKAGNSRSTRYKNIHAAHEHFTVEIGGCYSFWVFNYCCFCFVLLLLCLVFFRCFRCRLSIFSFLHDFYVKNWMADYENCTSYKSHI